MLEFDSGPYRATIDDGILYVFCNEEPVIRKTTWLPDGSVQFDTITAETGTKSERSLLSHRKYSTVFTACYGGRSTWHCDIDCGAQRFNGKKTSREVKKALQNCRFGEPDIREMLKTCRRTVHKSCARQY